MSLVPLMIMYSDDEKRRKCKYSKISAGSAQNEQINSKKWPFALLLLTNPLSYTIRHNISMGLVAIGAPLSLTLGWQRVIIMVILVILDFGWWSMTSCTKITRNSNFKPPSFWIHHGKAIFLVATHPVCHFPSFKSSPSIRVHQGRLVGKRIIEKEQDLIEKTPGQMEISTWWEDLGTQLNTRTIRTYVKCGTRLFSHHHKE
jgi:hypothetical protein